MRPDPRPRSAQPPLVLLSFALLFAIVACGGGSSRQDGNRPAETTRPDAEPTEIGTFEDTFDFLPFGAELDEALERQDLSFFVENVALQDVSCDIDLPAPPESCAGADPGASRPAVLLSVWEAGDLYLDGDQYREFMTAFLSEYAESASDSYGGAAPRLYAYATIEPALRPTQAAGETVEAVVTRIARTASAAEREALLITATFDGDRWSVSRLTRGPAAFLQPTGPGGSGADAAGVFEFWRRWQD